MAAPGLVQPRAAGQHAHTNAENILRQNPPRRALGRPERQSTPSADTRATTISEVGALQPLHLVVILIIVFVIFGAGRLSDVGHGLRGNFFPTR